jgi:hypothetical protein
MDVSTQIGRDHPIDLQRVVTNPDGSATHEHLLTFIPVQFRGGNVKFCFLGRSDVNILRDGARNWHPPATASSTRPAGRFSNLAMTLKSGDLIRVGTGLLDLRLLSVCRGRATIKATILSDGLLLNLEPLSDGQELNLRRIIERLNRGADYRSDAL